jgi:poly-gamma-glutamate capsule biosynthesis protein CapA/YwtB (metallophosphatase superfamily)
MKRCTVALFFATAIAAPAHAEPPVRLAFVGDVMLDGGPGRTIRAGSDPFARVAAELASADAAVANLECPVATTGAPVDKIYTFRAEPAVVPFLARHFAAVTLANNHTGDYGPKALLETMALLDTGNVPFFGAGRDLRTAHRALVIVRRGVRIALLGYDEFLPRSFAAGSSWPGVAWSEDEDVVSDIRAARAQGADIVIPFMHWGWEYEPKPSARQVELARRMIDAGADAVVGSHPHVTQTADYYRGRPIVYSLGNFVFDGFEAPETRSGWILELDLGRTGATGFRTKVIHLDADGSPALDPDAPSPCGEHGVVVPCATVGAPTTAGSQAR